MWKLQAKKGQSARAKNRFGVYLNYKSNEKTMNIEKLKYPIGHFEPPKVVTAQLYAEWVATIAAFPKLLIEATKMLTEQQLDTPYRPDGWTVRQVVHHCADSHLNSFVRFKLALTEDNPTIKPYFEERWAMLPDSETLTISSSLKLLEGLHERWAALLNGLTETERQRTFFHPEHQQLFVLENYVGFYAWHCRHHLAHITSLKAREGRL